jgi:hypothetical protein
MNDELAERLVKAVEHIARSLPLLLESIVMRSGPAPAEKSAGAKRERSSEPSGVVEEVIASVLKISIGEIRNGKNAGGKMWWLTLRGEDGKAGKRFSIFSEKQIQLAADADESGRLLRVTYKKDGKYDNLVSIAIHGAAPAPAAPPPTSPLDDEETPF